MKNPVLSFILLSFISTQLPGQAEFAPPGATWSYSFQTFWTSFNGFLVLEYEKDTVLSGILCKKLKGSILDSSLTYVQPHDVFVRQSADSIFTVFLGSGSSHFLFKNQYQLNETAEFGFLWNEPLTVSAIETLNFGSQTTKKYVLDSDGWLFDQTAIYEKFGPELGFFQSWWGVAVDGESYKLLCYQDDEFPLAEVGNGPCFGLTPTVGNAPSDASFTVFPNPVSDEITFDFQGKNADSISLEIWDVASKLVISRKLSTKGRLDVSSLPSGIYLGNAFAEGQTFPFKFVKL